MVENEQMKAMQEKIQNQEKAEKIWNERKQKNIKKYPIYRMFAWDLLFYYSIIYLFLTIEKGLTPAEALQFDAFYVLFKSILQIPCTILIEKIGKRKSIVIANVILIIHIVIIMASRSFVDLLISQILCAFAFNIKTVCETDMLYDSLEHGEKRGIIFSKIDGKANSIYYYMDAISAIIASFTFVINSYIPLILCMIVLIIAFYFSLQFEEVGLRKKSYTIKEELKNIRYSLRNVFRSKRLRSLLLFNVVFVAMLRFTQTTRNTVLTTIGLPEQYFGIIFAILGIISGIAAKEQGKIHKRYRNHTLAFLAIPMAVSIVFLGFTTLWKIDIHIILPIIIVFFIIQYSMKGPYYVLIRQYLNNFTNSEKRIKITTANNLFENFVVSILLFVFSAILENVSISYALLIVGCIMLLLVTWVLEYMRNRVGKPVEEYSKRDLI